MAQQAQQGAQAEQAAPFPLLALPNNALENVCKLCNRGSRRALRLASKRLLQATDNTLARIPVVIDCGPGTKATNGLVISGSNQLRAIQQRFPSAERLQLVQNGLYAAQTPGIAALAAALSKLPDASWPGLSSYNFSYERGLQGPQPPAAAGACLPQRSAGQAFFHIAPGSGEHPW